MVSPSESLRNAIPLYGLAFCVLIIVFASTGVTTRTSGVEPDGPVLPTSAKQELLMASLSTPRCPRSARELENPPNPDAPAPGSAYFRAPAFAELDDANSSPGMLAARELLVRSHNGDAAAAEAQYRGRTKKGFDEYQRAVFLNTVAAIQARDHRLLENARFMRFYDGKKKQALPFGIILSGVTDAMLDQAQMGRTGLLGLFGRRSPKTDNVASLEATPMLDGKDFYAFDVDLYNLKSDADKHTAETDFNDTMFAATHPADVARALQLRGIFSGVTTR